MHFLQRNAVAQRGLLEGSGDRIAIAVTVLIQLSSDPTVVIYQQQMSLESCSGSTYQMREVLFAH